MKEWQIKAIELLARGMSTRQISSIVGKGKSRVAEFLKEYKEAPEKVGTKQVKILLLDIETAPMRAFAWQRWKQNIAQSMVISEGFVLSFATKWLGEESVYYERINDQALKCEDDKELIQSIWNFIDQADIVIAHNAKGFDIPILNSRFVYHGLTPPSSYKVVDTLLIARRNFRFPSNSLDSLAAYLNLGRKVSHEGFDLWKKCLEGDAEAWDTMEEYNIHDIHLLEQVYITLRAWDSSHPNVSIMTEGTDLLCPCCGSTNLEQTENYVYTSVSMFNEFVCLDCGKRSRGRKNRIDHDREILVNAR